MSSWWWSISPRPIFAVAKAAILFICLSITTSANAQGTNLSASTYRSATGDRQIALVIGNADYPTSPLQNPVNDAAAVARALRHVKFEVFEHRNLNARDMRRAIGRFAELVNRDTTVVFYFAGHGLQARGRNFLIPIDAEIKRETAIRSESIDLEEVMENFSPARTTILILDACRNNPFERRFRAAYSSGLAQVDAPKGTLIAYATAPGKVALDGDDRSANGIYTEALVRAMGLPGLRIEETFKRVRQDVSSATNDSQIPWESSSLTGDFCFGGCNRENPLTAEIERLQRERASELAILKRESDLLRAEKALAEKQRQIVETELREKSTKQDALTEKLKEEKAALASEKKKLLDEYEKRLADEVSARSRAEDEAKRLGTASSLELAKLKREKELLENEKALAEKQRQILENELKEKNNQQQALSEKLLKDKEVLASDRKRILGEYEKRLAEEAAARARAEDEAKRLGTASSLELAKLKREKELLENEKALAEKQRQILENELKEKNNQQQTLSEKLLKDKEALAADRKRILADYERKLAEEALARARAEDEVKKVGAAAKVATSRDAQEAARLSREIEQLRIEKQKLEDARRAVSQEVIKAPNSPREKPVFIPPMF